MQSLYLKRQGMSGKSESSINCKNPFVFVGRALSPEGNVIQLTSICMRQQVELVIAIKISLQ